MSRPSEDWMRRMPLSPLDNGVRRGKLRAVKSLDLAAFNSRRPASKAATMPALRTVKSMAFDESSDSEADECLSLSPPLGEGEPLGRAELSGLGVGESLAGADLSGLGVVTEPRKQQPVQQPVPSMQQSVQQSGHSEQPRAPQSAPPHRTHRRALSRITSIGKIPPLEKPEPERTPLNSPKVDQLCIFTAADAVAETQGDESLGSLQDILSILAQKERQVLEARDALKQARGELKVFRDHLRHIMDPYSVPLGVCTTPRIISRRLTPNVGINGLHMVPRELEREREPQMFAEIDREIFRESMAFRLVHSLLGLVHCIISIFPGQRPRTEWSREYLSPTGLLYGMGE